MTMNDEQLKSILAQLLPDHLEYVPYTMEGDTEHEGFLARKGGDAVPDTELLYFCAQAESYLTPSQRNSYASWLEYNKDCFFQDYITNVGVFRIVTKTWQERTKALAHTHYIFS